MLRKHQFRRKVKTRPKQKQPQDTEPREEETYGSKFWSYTVKEIRDFVEDCEDQTLLATMLDAERQHPEYSGGRTSAISVIERRLAELKSHE